MNMFADESATTIPVRLRRDRSHPGADQPHEGLLDRIRSVTPLIAKKSAEAESMRRPHDDVVAATHNAPASRIDFAESCPEAPMMPPPGWVPEPHIQRPLIGVL